MCNLNYGFSITYLTVNKFTELVSLLLIQVLSALMFIN